MMVSVLTGKIQTLDPARPKADAIAIHEGRISYVGHVDGAHRSASAGAEIIDLGERVALPGFVESHSHPIFYGRSLEEVDCRYAGSLDDIVVALRDRARNTPPGEWVVGNGYDHTLLQESRHPTRRELDRASSEHPVLLRNITGHSMVVNSEVLWIAGVTKKTPDPKGGHVGREKGGEPDGVLWEGAQGLVQKHLPEVELGDVLRYLQNASGEYLAAGVTSVVDAAIGFILRDARRSGLRGGRGGRWSAAAIRGGHHVRRVEGAARRCGTWSPVARRP
jgi:predicted amidohydrolase YtcJ